MLNFTEGISLKTINLYYTIQDYLKSDAEFKEFEPWLKNGWFHLKKVYSMFHELSRRSIETGFWWNLDAAQIYKI